MTIKEAVAFLERHQPMASDRFLSPADFATYREVLELAGASWLENPPEGPMDPRLVGPLMGALGDVVAGLHDEADYLLRRADRDVLRPHVLSGLASEDVDHRIWSIRIAEVFEDSEVTGILQNLFETDPDEEVRLWAKEVLEVREENANRVKSDA